MFELIRDAGFAGWSMLLLAIVGVALAATLGRKAGRPGAVAVAFALAVMAQGGIGFGLGQRMVERAAEATADAAEKVAVINVGTREASTNLLLGGVFATLVLVAGGALALAAGGLRASEPTR